MSTEEYAVEILIEAGYMEETKGGRYKLLWDKLNDKKKELGI